MGLFNFGKPKDEKLQIKIDSLEKTLSGKKRELQKLQIEIADSKEIMSLQDKKRKLRKELERLNEEIKLGNDELNLQEFGFFERHYKFSDSTKYKDKLWFIRYKEKEAVKSGEAGQIISPMLLDNSASKGKTMQKQLIKAMIRGFNGEAESLLVKITATNVEAKIKSLRKSFEQLNRMYSRNLIKISHQYLQLKIEELRLAAEYELQKEEERQLLREQREKEREDKKLQVEIKAKRKQVEKERNHFKNMIEKVEELLKSANNEEVDELKKQLLEYQHKLSELDELEADIDYREGHATAGYVYIISNIGSFGENIYKIGVTRRLEPLERIRELSSASVPFHFDVHALIFSEEAFALEAELHKEFSDYRVNKMNNRKEYFNVSFEQIKKSLEKHSELAIEINETPEAFEYRQTLASQQKL